MPPECCGGFISRLHLVVYAVPTFKDQLDWGSGNSCWVFFLPLMKIVFPAISTGFERCCLLCLGIDTEGLFSVWFILFNLPFPQLLLLFYTKVFTKEASVFLTVIPDPSWLGSCCNSEAPVTLSGPFPGLQVMSGIALSSEKKKGGKHACFFFPLSAQWPLELMGFELVLAQKMRACRLWEYPPAFWHRWWCDDSKVIQRDSAEGDPSLLPDITFNQAASALRFGHSDRHGRCLKVQCVKFSKEARLKACFVFRALSGGLPGGASWRLTRNKALAFCIFLYWWELF